MGEYFPSWQEWLRGAGRVFVFLFGGVAAFGSLAIGRRYKYPILGYAEMLVLIGLALATPVLFCLATFGPGDRWTVRYVLAWMGYIVALCIGGLVAMTT